ncbi:MAG: condensation domain-containing protein [Blautia sp.]|nr:condensation domain-containing protein [Blautia sp.]MCM1200433.1 condensation domain-containing protein [Bacteroides fragilis]
MKTRKGCKTYPLTVAQKFHNYYAQYSPGKEILNVGTSLTIEFKLNLEELRKAIYKAYERCESMRARLAYDQKEGEWYQYIVEKEEREIEVADFTGKTMEEAEAEMTAWTRVPFDKEDAPMNRVVIIRTPDGFEGMYIVGDHRFLDAQSLIGFLKDVIELYCSANFENIPYPADMRSYTAQIEKDLAYENGSKAQERDRAYFRKLIEESEPVYNGIEGRKKLEEARAATGNPNLRAAPTGSDSFAAAIDIFHLEEEPTKRLMTFCEQQHISLQCLLIMGIRTYLQKVNQCGDVSMQIAYARRATLQEKKSGGTRIHCFPFRTVISEEKTFLEGIREIRDKQNEVFRYVNFDPGEYLSYRSQYYQPPHGMGYEAVSLTYQPATLREKGLTDLGGIRYKTKRYCNGYYSDGLYLTVMHRPEDNGLDFSFEHQIKAYNRKQLEYFYYYVCRLMFKGAENPNLKIGDIIKLV